MNFQRAQLSKPDVTDALDQGLPVKLPDGANAVRVMTERGRVATVIERDLDTLKGAGPYKSATAGHVSFYTVSTTTHRAMNNQKTRNMAPNWKSFTVVKGLIEVIQ